MKFLSSSAGPVAEGAEVVATVVQKGVRLTWKRVRISSFVLQSLLPRCDFSMCAVNKGSEEAALCCCRVLRGSVGQMGDSNNLQGSSKQAR